MHEMIEDEAFENESAVHENAVDFIDRRLRQLSAQYHEITGRQSFVARVPAPEEGFDRWHFADGLTYRNGFDALEYQYVLMRLAGIREF